MNNDTSEFAELRAQLELGLDNQQKSKLKFKNQEEREKNELAAALARRKITLGQTVYDISAAYGETRPKLFDDVLYYPTLILYPETNTSDFVSAFDERTEINTQIYEVVGDGYEWVVYLELVDEKFLKVSSFGETKYFTLGEVLEGRTLIGQPVLHVMRQRSDVEKTFLENHFVLDEHW